jgi:hypothetical protein
MKRPPLPQDRVSAPTPAQLRVSASDLERLDAIQGLLTTLNDPRASAGSLARYVQESSVLSARIEDRYRQRNIGKNPPRLAEQIAILGNREIEGVLLELLEDIVALHSELKTG